MYVHSYTADPCIEALFYRINSILLSRFLLDLRSVYQADVPAIGSIPVMSSVRFTSTIAGNMGATLDDAWATGRARDDLEDKEPQYSQYPFAVGLLEDNEDLSEQSHREKVDSRCVHSHVPSYST